jgi:hypothetical protein
MAGRLPGMTPQQRRTTWTDRIGQFNGGVFKSDQPRNYPLSKSTALCVNTAFAYPYYIFADPVSPQEVARPEPGDLRNHAVRHP